MIEQILYQAYLCMALSHFNGNSANTAHVIEALDRAGAPVLACEHAESPVECR